MSFGDDKKNRLYSSACAEQIASTDDSIHWVPLSGLEQPAYMQSCETRDLSQVYFFVQGMMQAMQHGNKKQGLTVFLIAIVQ